MIIGTLAGIVYLARVGSRTKVDDQMHNAGTADVAFDLAAASPATERALGLPIREAGPPRGQVRLHEHGGYAQGVIPVAGPKGTAKLFFVGNNTSSGWEIEAEEISRDSDQSKADLTPPVRREDLDLPTFGRVYLAPLDARAASLLAPLPEYYQAKLGLDVAVLPTITPPNSVEDAAKHEVVASRLVSFLDQSYPQFAFDPATVMIGVSSKDMEAEIYGLHRDHALNLRANSQIAVISLGPIEPKSADEQANPLVLPVRLRKAITRDIGLMVYPLTMSADPTSVLYATRGDSRDIDLMGENFRNAVGEWAPGWGDGEPTIDITRLSSGKVLWRLGTEPPPTDVKADSWQSDLAIGLFVQEQTDFYYNEPSAYPFVRAYRPRDNWSRAFGIGTSHTFDLLLIGIYGSWCDVVTEEGGRIHFSRNWWKLYSQEYLLSTGSGSSQEAVLRFDGRIWHLQRSDGWTLIFPNGYAGHRPQQSAMIGMIDAQGRPFEMQRDKEGNLLHSISPMGNRIDFRYDYQGRVSEAYDNHGRTVRYTYDARGRLAQVEDSAGRVANYEYDDRNDMTQIKDGSSHVLLTNDYDAAGWVTLQQLADGRSFTYHYQRDAQGNLHKVEFTDPQGYVIDYFFDRGGYWQSWPKHGEAKTP
jgi:YD repeat-containing protein